MSRRTLLGLAIVSIAVIVSVMLWNARHSSPTSPGNVDERDEVRIVSLSPAITESLYAIGAGDLLVGRSDYCAFPKQALVLPMAGTTIKPNLETLARLEPTLILGEKHSGTPFRHLQAIARTELLAWLNLDDLHNSMQRLGKVAHRQAQAEEIFEKMEAHLAAHAPASGPRVLLAMAHDPGRMQEIFYFRKDSLHGAALHAAGGINAVQRTPKGTPSLSLEEVLSLDPDMIVILSADDSLSDVQRKTLLGEWRRLAPLKAAKEGRISVLAGARFYSTGPRIMELTEELRSQIARIGKVR